MANTVKVIQVIAAIILVISILLQHRGTGLGGAFGGEDLSYRSRRGVEKLLFRTTIVFAAIFIVAAIAQLFL
jgi:protein translocase SecG subunit